jgi:cell division septation protein DedD/thioredoxin-related protein
MNAYRFSHILFLTLMVLIGTRTEAQTIAFSKGNLAQAKSKSVSEGKLYFAYFYTDWCLPCKWMEENTFKDAELIQFIQQNYLAVKLNIDDKDGHQMREQYNVEFLPTLLIFNQSGDIVDRFEESLPAAKMLDALKKHRLNMAGASVKLPPLKKSNTEKTETPKEQIAKESIEKEMKPAPVKEAPAEMPRKETPVVEKKMDEPKREEPVAQPKPTAPTVKTETAENKAPVKPTEAPAQAAAKEESPKPADKPATTSPAPSNNPAASYYAVQVGTFSRFENADIKRNELKEMFGEGVHIKIDNTGKDTIYRVMIGRYQVADAARSLVGLLKEQGIEGFIKEIKID